ncbi:hypothetical protein LTR36_000877 [Oleoguttula mirabilis]|uniref:Protein HRI1 n=1 Tax=Oleoguttula mirabilis TaxID=1507867 RepID=A0AAV9J3Q8_9PEZI|nr:hypothetical protein LTR36_000877 [Oleoguttula mirabilis]
MAPSISVREFVRWLPEQASEPTSTLVLTSAESRFVDIRIFRAQHGSEVVEATEGEINTLPSSRLEWAFAGTSSTELRHPPDGGQAVVHSTWKHWVDCRKVDVDGVVDEGDMYPKAGGRTLETGSMVDPATGKLTEYEEMWKDLQPVAVGQDSEEDGRKGCVVLQLQDDEHEARGVVVRVGQYVQGVLRVGKRFSLERWEWKGKEEGWKRLVRIGDLWVPCGVATEEGRLEVGGEVKHGEFVWKVIEHSYF